MNILLQDLRFGLRALRRQPLFTGAAILVLALGIGANVAVFSVIEGVILKALPYPEPERLVVVKERLPLMGPASVAYLNYVDWQAGTRSFDELALQRKRSFNVAFRAGGGMAPERIDGAQVSANLLKTLGLSVQLGRNFQDGDDVPGAAPVALISDRLWRRQFAADRNVTRRSFTVDGIVRQIIGVLPAEMDVPHRADLYLPLADLRNTPRILDRGNHESFSALGRLKSGVTIAQAYADLNNVTQELNRRYPDTNSGEPDVHTLLEATIGSYRSSLYLLLGAVGCVLLIACANVANLQLARATSRRKELAVRVALGASRWRLVRQMLTEGVLLTTLSGILAVLVALWAIDAVVNLVPADLPRFQEVRLGLPGLAFAALVALGTGLLVGVWPAWRMSSTEVMSAALRQGSARGSTGGPGQHRMRSLLVVAQMSLAVVLLAGAGLTLKSFYRSLLVPLGFQPKGLLTLAVALPEARYNRAQKQQFFSQLLDKVRALPGVKSASMGENIPFSNNHWRSGYHVTGAPPDKIGEQPTTEQTMVSPGYFQAMGISILSGRDFGGQEVEGRPPSMIVDETFAKAHFPGQNPVGQHVDDQSGAPGVTLPPYTIVGVVAHTHNEPPGQANEPENPYQFYLCNAQSGISSAAVIVVRVSSGDPLRLAGPVRRAVQSLDAEVPVGKVATMEQLISQEFAPRRLTIVLLAVFAGLALVLASIGLYGVTALGVTQRTRELGIRLALGAQRSSVLGLIVRQGMKLVAIGLLVGLLVSVGMGRALASALHGVSGNDPITLTMVALVLGTTALLACWLPALRVMRVDPMLALREE